MFYWCDFRKIREKGEKMKKLRVEGRVKMIGQYIVDLDITEEEFENLSVIQQNQLIEEAIDFSLIDIDEIEIDDNADITTVE